MPSNPDSLSTVADLLRAVHAKGGDVAALFFGSGNPNDRYAVVPTGNGWEVYYSERGEKVALKSFPAEALACAYAMQLLVRDATVWHKTNSQ